MTHGHHVPPLAVSHEIDRLGVLLAACPTGSVIGGRSAARLHGLWLPDDAGADRVDVLVHHEIPEPRDRCASRRPEVRARRRKVFEDERMCIGALSVTTPARTWLDLAEELELPDLVALGDSVVRGGTPLAEIRRLIARAHRRRGIVVARLAVDLIDPQSRSRPESHLRVALVCSGLPKPHVNEAIFDDFGQWLAEPDLSYADVRLALEYNGADHFSERQGRRDITRTVDVEGRGGWRVVTFGPAEVFGRPWLVATHVKQLRAERLALRR